MENNPAISARPPSLDDVCGKAIRLPSAPSLMPRLIAVLEDTASGAEEIEGIIQLDPALTASTLRLANSAYFGSGCAVETVADAVIRLGLREICVSVWPRWRLVNRWDSGEVASGRTAAMLAIFAAILALRGPCRRGARGKDKARRCPDGLYGRPRQRHGQTRGRPCVRCLFSGDQGPAEADQLAHGCRPNGTFMAMTIRRWGPS